MCIEFISYSERFFYGRLGLPTAGENEFSKKTNQRISPIFTKRPTSDMLLSAFLRRSTVRFQAHKGATAMVRRPHRRFSDSSPDSMSPVSAVVMVEIAAAVTSVAVAAAAASNASLDQASSTAVPPPPPAEKIPHEVSPLFTRRLFGFCNPSRLAFNSRGCACWFWRLELPRCQSIASCTPS